MRIATSLAAFAVAATIGLTTVPAAAVTYYVNTGQVNANEAVFDGLSPGGSAPSWTFNVGANVSFNLGGGDFEMKSPNADKNIYLSLYLGNSLPNDVLLDPVTGKPTSAFLVGQKEFTPAQFYAACEPGFTCTSSYEPVNFYFGNPLPALTGPQSYFLQLTSIASNNTKYFIKYQAGTALSFTDEGGNPVDPGTGCTPVPEPATMALLGIGLLGLGVARRRTSAETAPRA